MMYTKPLLFLGAMLWGISLNAQTLSPDVLANAGQVSYTGNISLSWTLGEGFVSTLYYEDRILTQGFHQPLLQVMPVENTFVANKMDIQVFPNPVTALLSVKLKADSDDELTLELLDLMGRRIFSRAVSFSDGEFDIEMNHLPASIYILRFSDSQGNRIQTHTVSKIH